MKFAKGTRNCKSLHILMSKEKEKMDDPGCPKNLDLIDPKADEELLSCLSDPVKHKTTLHCAQCKANYLGDWSMQHLKLSILYCAMVCQYLRN